MLTRLQNLPPALRQSLVYGLALALSKGISLLMVPVTTAFLAPAAFGQLDVLQTLADLLSILIAMGLADTLFRFVGDAKHEEDRRIVAANVFGMAMIITAITTVGLQLLAPLIAGILPGGVTEIQARILLGALSLSVCLLVPLSWLRMRGRAWMYFIGTVGRVVLQAGGTAIVLFLGFGVTAVLTAGLVASVLTFAWLGWQQLRDSGIRFEPALCKRYFVFGSPLIFAGLAGFVLGSFDRWILADVIGPAAMAQYALAAKFALITAFVVQPFDLWWLPKRFSTLNAAEGEERCAAMAQIGVTIALGASIFVAAVGPVLIFWLTPESYHGAIEFVPWLALLASVHSITQTLSLGLYTGRSTHMTATIDGVAALVAGAGYFALIPSFGAFGAIYATSFALGLRLVMTVWMAQLSRLLPYRLVSMSILFAATTSWLGMMHFIAFELVLVVGALGLGFFILLGVELKLLPLPRKWSSKRAMS
ncbi:MAG: oligosaccharide flippase family protein [Rhodospirillales bacterium]|nr:oligosaccharide flippase family protein [Rhodospirillales bacterium]